MKSRKLREATPLPVAIASTKATEKPVHATTKGDASLPAETPASGAEKFEEMSIYHDYPDQRVQIGKELPPHMREEMILFLSTHLHNFAWNTGDMPEIDPTITEH